MSRPVTPTTGAPAQTLSRSNSQRLGHAGSRPVSFVGRDDTGIEAHDQYSAAPRDASLLSQSAGAHDDHYLGSDGGAGVHRSASQLSQSATAIPSRGNTLKKKASLRRTGSLNRSGSKKSSYAGSVRSMRLGEKEKYEPDPEHNSAFFCPVPITGSPTDLLADRFQAWRKVLKDIIAYFRDVQKSYETRSKTLHSASNTISNLVAPPNFLQSGGIADATQILQEFHKQSLSESNKSRELENEVIQQLTGLRSDLQQKIKEIKSLSGDFKNSVSKEQDGTRKAIRALQESVGHVDHDAASTAGRGDPFLVKLSVDRQVGRQIEEENYLHRAYLNLEASGRELESIVVGEIQKAYNVLAGIMKREADHSYETVEKLREGPIAMAKDHEWDAFVTNNDRMVDPRLPLRQLEQITYPGKDHPAAIEVRSGMLERKSKYLKSYTPGWYVLSPTHLHEFKSADRISFQSPIMSLYLPEQKLGTHSEPGSNSHKFMLKGRQTGTMHRGHSWIFRAETHDTMVAWFGDIKELTEKRGEERNEFVRRTHARTLSSSSNKAPSIGSGSGMEDDEADRAPFSAEESIRGPSVAPDAASGVGVVAPRGDMMDDQRSEPGWRPQRPTPGGRFPSDLNVQRGLQASVSPSSGDSLDETDREAIASAGALPGSGIPFVSSTNTQPHTDLQQPHTTHPQPHSSHHPRGLQSSGNEKAGAAASAIHNSDTAGISNYTAGDHHRVAPTSTGAIPVETASTYGEWMAPIAAGVGGTGLGAAGATAYDQHRRNRAEHDNDQQGYSQPERVDDNHRSAQAEHVDDQQIAIPTYGHSSAPIMDVTAAPIDAPRGPRAGSENGQDMAANSPASTYAAPVQAREVPQKDGIYARDSTMDSAPSAAYPAPAHTSDGAQDNTFTQSTTTTSAPLSIYAVPLSSGRDSQAEPSYLRDTATDNASRSAYNTSSTQDATSGSNRFSAYTASTVPTTTSASSGVGVDAPAPSQTLAAAGIQPYPQTTQSEIAPISTSDLDTYRDADAAGHKRPQMPHSAKSVQTISDLHVPGEFPKNEY
ncbi:phosphatidylinositol 4,5-bisphosphate-binding protein [Lithohypha guttulata]|uniref:phosphatidylinositol 4,5-bisphosphate-binding protein n=1 Tax=Lithohypha guttulata TaxID=1690604 RepID=UPI002DE1EB73|nr:phosphatidylinositol 4,5-bisphosphate-binding protein [Lithohypha guttulata]